MNSQLAQKTVLLADGKGRVERWEYKPNGSLLARFVDTRSSEGFLIEEAAYQWLFNLTQETEICRLGGQGFARPRSGYGAFLVDLHLERGRPKPCPLPNLQISLC